MYLSHNGPFQQYEIREAEVKKEKEFKHLSENLHHLVSTKHIRGVYNPHSAYLEVCICIGRAHTTIYLLGDMLLCDNRNQP